MTRNFLYKRSYNPEKVLASVTATTSSVIDLQTLLQTIIDLLASAFQSSKMGVVLLDKRKKLNIAFERGFSAADRVFVQNKEGYLSTYFRGSGDIVIIDELKAQIESGEYQPKNPELLIELEQLDIALLAPLFVKERLIGLLVAGSKKSGELYSSQDLQTLGLVVPQTVIAIENAQLYEELKAFNRTLQQRIDAATIELRQANERLREMDRLKSDFISIASHQLRTPLTVIKGYVSMMQEGNFGKVPDTIKEQLAKIFAANERLIELVENLLDITRIESGRQEYKFEPAMLDKMAATVVENLKKNADDKGLKLKFAKPKKALPAAVVDLNKLHEVMMNFTDNAIKYTKEGSVTVSVVAEPEGMITFSVQDTGVGISQDALPHLFEKFSRGQGSFQMHTEGLGLGLYVARMIVDAHHGIIGAESLGQGKGSRFFFSVPLQHSTEAIAPHEPIRKLAEKAQ